MIAAARIAAALERAREDAERPPRSAAEGRDRPVRVVVGDPQAPLERFLSVLAARGLLGADGRLRAEVRLVSIGDHFDWGGAEGAEAAARSGLALLSWLAAHPPDQVVLIAGNHDLARVGELVGFDDATWAGVRAEAARIYGGAGGDAAAAAALLARHPALATVEVAARDLASFATPQRDLVVALLRGGRLRLAHAAAPDVLVSHAGVTVDDLARVGVRPGPGSAPAAADALNAALAASFAAWDGRRPLVVEPGLHRPGGAGREGGGLLYHRAADPERFDGFAGPFRRRYDPRRLPAGLTQVIGHVSDRKSRELLPRWADAVAPRVGVLRHLVTDGRAVRYAHGPPPRRGPGEAAVVFTDGGMKACPPADYELLDLDRLVALD